MTAAAAGQFRRVAETGRRSVRISIDGRIVDALAGDTLLTAMLMHQGSIRRSELDGGPRAGFCLMGACQDCWVQLSTGERVRACTTFVADGLAVVSTPA